jgi:hypothetical protein
MVSVEHPILECQLIWKTPKAGGRNGKPTKTGFNRNRQNLKAIPIGENHWKTNEKRLQRISASQPTGPYVDPLWRLV